MTQLNPITSAIIVNQQTVTRQESAQTAHIGRAQSRLKDITSTGDRYEPETVESVEKLDAAHDEQRRRQQQEKRPKKKQPSDAPEEQPPHLDVTA